MQSRDDHVVLSGHVVRVKLKCRGCGYDLRGLSATGTCPECGHPINKTVLSTLDPETSGLPRLRTPTRTAMAYLVMVIMMFLSTCLGVATTIEARLATVSRDLNDLALALLPPSPELVNTILLSAACVCSFLIDLGLKDRPQENRRSLLVLRVGMLLVLAGWVMSWADLDVQIVLFLAMLLVLWGLRGISRDLGRYSITWRRSLAGTQQIEPLIAATVAAMLGFVTRHFALMAQWYSIASIGALLALISLLLLIIGLIYVVWNACWILKAICSPPPAPSDLLEIPGGDPDTM